jgi:drug/metabolite transporter (DMT)-like permease
MDRNFKFLLLMLLSMGIWGGSWVCGKAISHNLHFQLLAFTRLVLSFLFLIPPVFIFKERLKIDRATAVKIFIGSLLYTMYSQIFFLGLSRGTAGIGGVLVTTLAPVITFAITAFASGQRLGFRDIAGLAMGLCGSLIIIQIWETDIDRLLISGNLFFLVGAVLWSGLTINSQKTQSKISIWVYSFYLNGFAVILQSFFAVRPGMHAVIPADFSFWAFMLYLSLFSTVVSTSIFFYAARHIGSQKTSAYMFLVPLCAVVLSWIFLNERPEYTTLFGGMISVVAVYLIQTSAARKDLHAPGE